MAVRSILLLIWPITFCVLRCQGFNLEDLLDAIENNQKDTIEANKETIVSEILTKSLCEKEASSGFIRLPLFHFMALQKQHFLVESCLKLGTSPDLVDVTGTTLLCRAVKTDDYELVDILLRHNADVNCHGIGVESALHFAAGLADLRMLKTFLSHKPALNSQDSVGWTPLRRATSVGSVEAARLLLEAGANPRIEDVQGGSALTDCLFGKVTGCVELLLDFGVDPNTKWDGYSALAIALDRGLLHTASKLKEKGANLDVINDKTGETLLGELTREGDWASMSWLLQNGADPNLPSKGQAPVILALQEEDTNALEILFHSGAKCDNLDQDRNTLLHLAVLERKPSMIEFLLQHGADPGVTNKSNLSPLHIAVKEKCFECAKSLVENSKAGLNILDRSKNTPLMLACQSKQHKLIRLLLKAGVDPNIANKKGNTALHIAVSNNDMESVRDIMASKDVNINALNGNSWTPLSLAEMQGNKKMVEFLQKLDPNVQDHMGESLLHKAVLKGDIKLLKSLRERKGLAMEVKDILGYTPAELAIKDLRADIVAELLDMGADPNAREQVQGNTLLHLAAIEENTEVMRVLAGWEKTLLEEKNKKGQTPLHMVVERGMEEMVKTLLTYRADPSIKDGNGDTALHLAHRKGYRTIANLLLDNFYTDADLKNADGKTALQLYVADGDLEIASRLLNEKNVDPNILDQQGNTLLHLAANEGNLKVVRLLMQHHASLDILNENGLTPLKLAIRKSHDSIVRALLEAGADPAKRDGHGDTALHEAVYCSDLQMLRLLAEQSHLAWNLANDAGDTPLHAAATAGHADAVALLLSLPDIDVSLKNKNDFTASDLARNVGRADIATLIRPTSP